MLEIVNSLSKSTQIEVENFLIFLGIYEDRVREKRLKRLLRKNLSFIKGKIGVEAGAGLGLMTEYILRLGVKKLYAVEENKYCYLYLKEKFKKAKNIEIINEKIQNFIPPQNVDFLFQELYGALLLDESILALERIRFKPEIILPDSGKIVGQVTSLKEINDPVINMKLFKNLKGVLVTDLFPNYKMKNPFVIAEWHFKPGRKNYMFKHNLKKSGEVLILGMEIWDKGEKVLGSYETYNWPLVFTPIDGKCFSLSFIYKRGYTDVKFDWIA